MLRDRIHTSEALKNFTLRGKGDSRIEALSDGVFALAIAMLLLSTSVPSTFDELWLFVSDLVPFSVCSIFIFWIWRVQVVFFQRFGLTEDQGVVRLTYLLIMLVLFYAYALKFLMNWLFSLIAGMLKSLFFDLPLRETIGYLMELVSVADMPKLMLIYGLGFISVFAVFALLYRRVLRHKNKLELSALEIIESKHSYRQNLGMVGVGAVSVFFAIIGLVTYSPWSGFLSGISYNLAIPLSFRLATWRKKALAEAGVSD